MITGGRRNRGEDGLRHFLRVDKGSSRWRLKKLRPRGARVCCPARVVVAAAAAAGQPRRACHPSKWPPTQE